MPKSANRTRGPLSFGVLAVLLGCAGMGGIEAAPVQASDPRSGTEAMPSSTEPRVELVADREGSDLVFYVDDYASNRPMEGLHLDVIAGSHRLLAREVAEGRYVLPADLLGVSPGQSVPVSVRGSDFEVLLSLGLPAVAADPKPPTDLAGTRRLAPVGMLAAGVILAALIRRRRGGQRFSISSP